MITEPSNELTTEPMLPVRYRVTARTVETADSATLRLEPVGRPLAPARPGQFMMLYAYGVGEVPISISGGSPDGTLVHTVRAVGAVSRALHDAVPGTELGVRGPFGTTWALDDAAGDDLVVVAGGIGLAPLRPVVLGALARRAAFGEWCWSPARALPASSCFAPSWTAGRPATSTSSSPSTGLLPAGSARSGSSPSRCRGCGWIRIEPQPSCADPSR